ncbi:MAG: hypothetical protein HPY57_16045 [Ignavibacteria bacterium]|nr:hypothetical protein [Ignavibacteria bacterium]
MKKTFQWLILTKYGRLVLALFFTVLFQVLSDQLDNNTLGWIGLGFFAYIIVFTLYVIVYAWIINPIKIWKENKKLK